MVGAAHTVQLAGESEADALRTRKSAWGAVHRDHGLLMRVAYSEVHEMAGVGKGRMPQAVAVAATGLGWAVVHMGQDAGGHRRGLQHQAAVWRVRTDREVVQCHVEVPEAA